ncbi:hypothetical protein WA026_022510 [Henosepilachna vigintioctopunctata]|uniref:Uncharacterized protein n=1 Tax=Henosepilachna vigintioctopunctata TaxID=420089 RepID=A0AAW1UG89_9CUCU
MRRNMKVVVLVSFFILGSAYGLLDVDKLDSFDDSILRDKCDERGGKGTYTKVKTARDDLQSCVEDLVDLDTLKKEIEESKKTGSMDEVFGKYCKKRPQLKTCLDKFLEKMKLCLIEDEKNNLNKVLNVLRELGDFACYKDGDRIAMFVAEQGPECIKTHIEGIKTCVNNTLKISPTVSINSLPNFFNGTKICEDMDKVKPCIVTELEKCDNTTPANVVDSVFRFIKKRACKPEKQRRSVLTKRSLADTPNHIKNLLNAYVKYTKSKCLTHRGDKQVVQLLESLNKTQSCIVDYVKTNLLVLLIPENVKDKIEECSKDFIAASEDCLPENEKYYPKFSQQIMGGLVDLMFKYKQNLTMSSWSTEVQSCFQNFKYHNNRQALLKCFEAEVQNTDSDYTKEYVCRRLSNASKCMKNFISSICIEDVAINHFKDEFEKGFR